VKCSILNVDAPSLRTISTDNPIYELLQEFKELTHPSGKTLLINKLKDFCHEIITEGPPVVCKPRRLTPEKLEIAKKQFQLMVEQGICRESKSDWSNPIHMVVKKDGTFRICGDYRLLNARTKPDRGPIPHIHDVTQMCHGCKILSKVDLKNAYYSVKIHPRDIHKTAVTTPFGLFEFLQMSFGLTGAASTFQRFMNFIFRDFDFVICFIDDILIMSRTYEEHMKHLRMVFERLAEYGLVINVEKCVFCVDEVEFLGHKVSADGVFPSAEKVEAIKKFELPVTQKDLRRFLSTLNFYRRFIKNAAEDQHKLNKFLKGKGKSNLPIQWSPETMQAFENCKNSIIESAYLAHHVPGVELGLMVDASSFSIGGAVHQRIEDNWQPLGFFSRALNEAQKKYSTYDRELLAIYESVKHFRYLLEARDFTIFTDHKPLTTAFKQNLDKATPLQCRYLNFISQFSTDIQHVPGKENVTADMLSRINELRSPMPIDFDQIADTQESDSEILKLFNSKMVDSKPFSLKLKRIMLPIAKKPLVCDVSTDNIRIYVPKQYRHRVFLQYHALSHPGIRCSRNLISKQYVWKNLNQDVAEFVRSCNGCQKSKVQKHTKSVVGRFSQPSERFQHVHLDIVGPLPISNGYRYILTMVDRFSKWPEAIPIVDQSALEVAKAFYSNWICRFGVPVKTTTDRGRNFESELFHQLHMLFGISRIHTTSYNPKANGLVERLHRTMKAAIMALVTKSHDWTNVLPTVLFGIRTALREDINCTAAEMLYGSTLRLPGDFFIPTTKKPIKEIEFVQDLKKTMYNLSPATVNHHVKNPVYIHKDLANCSHVFIRKDRVKAALEHPYEGPHEVVKRNEKYFEVRINKKNDTVSIDRLKPAYFLNTDFDEDDPTTVITRSGHKVRYLCNLASKLEKEEEVPVAYITDPHTDIIDSSLIHCHSKSTNLDSHLVSHKVKFK